MHELFILFNKLRVLSKDYPKLHLLLKNTIGRHKYYEYLTYCSNDKNKDYLDKLVSELNLKRRIFFLENDQIKEIVVNSVERKIDLMRIAVAASNLELIKILHLSGFESTCHAEEFAVIKRSNTFIKYLHEISNFKLKSDEMDEEMDETCEFPTLISKSLFSKTDNCYNFLESIGKKITKNAIESAIKCNRDDIIKFYEGETLNERYTHDFLLMLGYIFRNNTIIDIIGESDYISYNMMIDISFLKIVMENLDLKNSNFCFPVDWKNLPEISTDEKLEIYDGYVSERFRAKIRRDINLFGNKPIFKQELRSKLEEDLIAHLFYDDLPDSYFRFRRNIIGNMTIQRIETYLP